MNQLIFAKHHPDYQTKPAPFNSHHHQCLANLKFYEVRKRDMDDETLKALQKIHIGCMSVLASAQQELLDIVRYLDEMEREIDGETLDAMMAIRAGAKEVDIYRVMPANKGELNPGDWISLSKEAAESYLKVSGEASHIIERKVPADHIFWDRQDAKAFGYDPRGRAPERDIPSHRFMAVFEVISKMERDHHNMGAFQADDIKRIEKFFYNPETSQKLSRILRGRLEENPFTGEPFERAMLDAADMFAFDTLDPLLIYAPDESMKGSAPAQC